MVAATAAAGSIVLMVGATAAAACSSYVLVVAATAGAGSSDLGQGSIGCSYGIMKTDE